MEEEQETLTSALFVQCRKEENRLRRERRLEDKKTNSHHRKKTVRKDRLYDEYERDLEY